MDYFEGDYNQKDIDTIIRLTTLFSFQTTICIASIYVNMLTFNALVNLISNLLYVFKL